MGITTQETKTSLPKETVNKLSQLVQINRDSASGFQEAADAIDDKALASDFRVWAVDRTRQADELQALVEFNNGEAPEDRSWSAAAHQAWLNFRSALSGGNTYTVLAEAERGEDAIKERYEEILKDVAGSAATDLLQQQYASVKAVHDRVRDLRDARKSKK
ncbi:PA2169 family four-helix-bundle protein [Aeoliella sp. ICT_H6.2]|uniref:PA2169 family four-helix-bundle protein n=1 Tax=Aeoliella straminimaris TaxID=2954799 RepID=A0A9X2JFD7_9BACT|nr:PA2169 family four-helix-bundle protein [Aeoliella straminimaris]MCO6042358.1 PA2169 family four-helix-bundle protein [Aeoliella straminimaris]